MQGKILVVDDEPSIVGIIRFNLEREGFSVVTGYNGTEALERFSSESPDLVLLDVMMPEPDGMEVCRRIREVSNVPILMLTARGEEVDKVLGLELGADDYITKPFGMRELVARVRANLRRGSVSREPEQDGNKLEGGGLTLLLDSYQLMRGETEIVLTAREMELLRFLMERPGQVFSRDSLMDKVWNYGSYGDARTVDVTVRHLREKIEEEPSDPKLILTKRGVGYYFKKD